MLKYCKYKTFEKKKKIEIYFCTYFDCKVKPDIYLTFSVNLLSTGYL